ncbi:hypothetical protein Tco_1229054 [Tanacetum coccineum]
MSDSEDSMVTYTAMSSPFANLPDIGSQGVDGPPVIPEDPYAYVVAAFQAPTSPDYMSGPEYPPSPDFVPEPVYPEFMPPENEVLQAKEQTLPAAASPTTDSPGYVLESDPKEDSEEDDDEDPKEAPADYPTDGGDDGDDEDESSDDDEDDDVDIKEDEEEEEHPAPADSTVVGLPAVDQAPSAEETKPFETDESTATPPPHPAYCVARLLAIPTPPPLPFSPWSLPLPQIPSPPLPLILSPLPLSPHLPISSPSLPASPTYPLGYRAAMIRLRAEQIHHRHILYSPTPEQIHHHEGHHHFYPYRYLLHHHLCLYSLLTVEQTDPRLPYRLKRGAPVTDDTELGRRMIEFTTRVRQDTDEIYTRLDDEQSERQLMAGRLNMLYRDRRAHARTARLMEVVAQQVVITELQAADRRRQAAIIELLAADSRRQAAITELLAGPAKGPAQPDAPEEAGSSS